MTIERAPSGRSRRWMYIFIGLLTVHAGSMIAMVVVATSDPSFAVEPDYYERALEWDTAAAQTRRNQELGWSVELSLGEPGRAGDLTLNLEDRDGRPLDGASVSIELFHHARSADRTRHDLVGVGEGKYRVQAPMNRPGMWEVRVRIRRGPETFTQTMQVEVAAGGGAS